MKNQLRRRVVMGGVVDVEYGAQAAVLFAQLIASSLNLPGSVVNPAMKAWFKRYEKEADQPWEQICFYLSNRVGVGANILGHELSEWLGGKPIKISDLT